MRNPKILSSFFFHSNFHMGLLFFQWKLIFRYIYTFVNTRLSRLFFYFFNFFRYGRVFKSHLFGSPTVVSCDLELNTFILQNEEKLFQSSYPKQVHDILGKLSLMLVSGDLHRKLRNVALSFTTTSKSRPDFLHYVEKLSISVMKSWKDRRQVLFFKEAKEVRRTSHL